MVAQSAVVLVPMYNEAPVIRGVLDDLCRHFDHIVCIDDGSADDSAEIARSAGATVLRHRNNLGQGAALQTGFDYVLRRTAHEHVVTFDADGQHSPDDARAMLEVARATGADAVLGSRTSGTTAGQPPLRRIVLRAAVKLSRLHTGLDRTDTHNGLRVLNRRALGLVRLHQRGMAHASELEALIARHGLTWVEHPVSVTYSAYARGKGQANLNAFNIVYDLVTARLHAPS